MKQKLLLFILPMLFLTTTMSAQWEIYHADVLPDAFTPAFQTSSAGTEYYNTIVADPDSPSNNLLVMECPGTSFYWRKNFANDGVTVTDLTVAMRVKGNPSYDVALDLDLHYGDYRTRVSFHKDYGGEQNVARIRNGVGTNTPLGVNLDEWHTYRFTMDINATTPVTYIYVDESTTPVMSIEPASSTSSNSHFRFGDGSSTTGEYGASIDWVVWDVTGAFSPVDFPLPNEVLSFDDFKSPVSTNIKAVGNRIYVSNVKTSTEVNIYSITGALVKSLKTNTDTDFSFRTGLYIATVKTEEGQKAVKLLTY